MAYRIKYDDKHPKAFLKTTTISLVDRCQGMEPLLEWVAKHQLNKVELHDVAGADAGMHASVVLSRNLWGYLNSALSITSQAKDFFKVVGHGGLAEDCGASEATTRN